MFVSCAQEGAARRTARARSLGSGETTVSATWLAANHCDVRVVDVREREETVGELGRIPGAEWIPVAEVEHVASSFASDEPVVVVCRSGRRAEHAARVLRELGMTRVAHLGGGMLAWSDFGLPVTREPPSTMHPAGDVAAPHAHDEGRYGRVVSDALVESGAVAWISASSLLAAGTLSCIDGRTDRPVIGAPGGDAGELILALAALEQATGRVIDVARIPAFFDEWAASFGRFYVHTDVHAIERLRDELRDDVRFVQFAQALDTTTQVESFVRSPPLALVEPLLEHLIEPPNVGCGHLRSMLQHPAAYGVRLELARAVLEAGMRHGYRHPGSLRYEVLEGRHAERAVVEVLFDRPVASYTRIAMVVPRGVLGEAFVLHPQVVAFVRHETSGFLVEHAGALGIDRVDRGRLDDAIDRLGDRQLAETLERLAPTLPRLVMRVGDSGVVVRQATLAE